MTDNMPKFEVPEAMRAFTEKSVDQAKKAFDDFLAATHGALSKVETASTGAQASVIEMQKTVMSLAEENVAAAFDHAQKLTKAKSLQEVVELQNAFIKARMAALGEQSRVVTETAQKAATSMTDAAKKA
jgi:phasin